MIESQSVKADAVVGSDSGGFDGGKLINGRKRHVVVDTLGLLLAVMVTAADVGDRAAAQVLLTQVTAAHHLPALVRADGGYTGSVPAGLAHGLLPVRPVEPGSDLGPALSRDPRRTRGAG
ncbi:transposase [Streptomyces sp. NPDC056525]|uniref:transposase n=1 Tax=unclassified Streptomyces TaxID=2593676 RepID=UPI0036A574FE